MQIRCSMEEEMVVERVTEIYEHISKLESLHPCEDVNKLFTKLVLTCMPPCAVDLTKLGAAVQDMRADLIRLCGLAEGLLEAHYADLLGSFPNPLDHVHIFPYYNNYLKLSLLEYTILRRNPPYSSGGAPKKVAFLGSGPLPLTSIVLAKLHLPATTFHNYDIDPAANERALRLVAPDADLSQRMVFHTADVMAVGQELREYEVVLELAIGCSTWPYIIPILLLLNNNFI